MLALNGTAHNNTENWTFPLFVVRLSLTLIPLLAPKKNRKFKNSFSPPVKIYTSRNINSMTIIQFFPKNFK
nr:MAG TPA: hypothetical protein [Caudoviricetes sp.]